MFSLPFYVTHSFDDASTTDPHQIEATNGHGVIFTPAIAPPDNDSFTHDKYFLALEPGSRRPRKTLPIRQARRLSNETRTVWGRVGILNDAIVRYEIFHGLRIMTVEGLVKFADDIFCLTRNAIRRIWNRDLVRGERWIFHRVLPSILSGYHKVRAVLRDVFDDFELSHPTLRVLGFREADVRKTWPATI
jgi:hypothetical protein